MRSFLIAALAVAASAGLCAAQPTANTEPTLTVRGQGNVRVPPDHANLTVEVMTKAKTAEDATAAHRQRASRAANTLREMRADGVEIAQSSFRLGEVHNGPPASSSREPEVEYQAVTSFELKLTKLDAVDSAITKIATTGLFQIRNLRFGIEDNNPGVGTARKNAVADARERASTYAAAAEVTLGDIVRIEDTEGSSPVMFAAGPVMRSVQVTPPETLALSASVTMTWRIKP